MLIMIFVKREYKTLNINPDKITNFEHLIRILDEKGLTLREAIGFIDTNLKNTTRERVIKEICSSYNESLFF